MDQSNPTASYLLAADSHNLGNTGTSWLDLDTWTEKLGNAGRLAATSVMSGLNSFYNTGVTVGNWFGADLKANDTQEWISSVDSDLGKYYSENTESADLGGFILGSLLPGLGGVKILNAGQAALKTAKATGFIGANLSKATGLLIPDTQKFVSLAANQLNSSTTAVKLLNANTVKALASGVWQNTLESAAFEIAAQATMFKSPILEKQDTGDILINIATGGVLGGAIGGSFEAAKTFGFLRKSIRAEDQARLPFIARPSFSEITAPSDRIITLAHDADSAAQPVLLKNLDGTVVQNNYAVNKTLYDDKIRKNFNDIRSGINELSGKDSELGNILANLSTPKPGEFGYSQDYLNNFAGALHVARPLETTPAESLAAQAVKKGAAPEIPVNSRYVTLIGEDAGNISDTVPTVLSLGDMYKGEAAIKGKVREYGFDQGKLWSALDLKGGSAAQEAEARHIWAHHMLKEVKDGATINRYDIPLLERAYLDGKYNVRIVDGEGPTLRVMTPTSKEELWKVLKESKVDAANEVLRKMSLDGSIPIEQGTAAAAKIVNAKQSFLEGFPTSNEFDDLMQAQAVAKDYAQSLKDKNLSTSVSEATTDPIFLPKVAKIVYNQDDKILAATENIGDAITYLKSKQKLYQDGAKNVVAKVLGKASESLPDLSDQALFTASRNGSGPGLFSAENSNYGTLGSSMAWIGSVTRGAKESLRKATNAALETPLVKLGQKPEAALEFESLNQKVTRTGKQFVLRETSTGEWGLVESKTARGNLLEETNTPIIDYEALTEGTDFFPIKNQETLEAVRAHIQTSGTRTDSFREIRAQQGHTDIKDPETFRPIRPNLKDYPHFAFVQDPTVTGTGHMTMIHAASEKELAGLIDRVPSNYKVITKTDTEDFFKARGEYEFNRTLHENYINTDLANNGVFSNFFPKSDPNKIINDILQQHLRESDMLAQEAVRLRYEPQFSFLEDLGAQYSKTATSKFASKRELIEQTSDNPYLNYIKTALDISKVSENPLIYGFNKMLDTATSKAVGAIRDTFAKVNSPAELEKMNSILDEYGMKPAYYDSALNLLANHSAPKGELTKFVRRANNLLSLFTLGLDPLNSLNNAIGANILRMTELRSLTQAIKGGDTEIAGELAKIAQVAVPGTTDSILAPTKLVSKAIQNFWKDDGALLSKYRDAGFIKDRVEQLKLLVDDFTLQGTETVGDLNKRMGAAFSKAKDLAQAGEKLSGNKLAEEFNRFISANVMDQITSIGVAKGVLDEPTAKAYINTFVNRVEGNIIASQRPLMFQGPVGQAIGLFQSYQFNLLQQLFRYVGEGSKKDIGTLLGLQSTLYGLQSLPAFQFVNTHILGQMSGNTEHRDAYDAVYGAAGRTAGDWILYGIPSNILQSNIYSRGDINPRQVTVLPTSLQEIPLVQGWGKFLGSMKESISKIAGGGNIWESILQGVEHNGISRPLAGFAQTLQAIPSGTAYSTSSKGSILYSNDLFSLATLTRLSGGRPLDEAVTNDALFRVRTYEATRRKDLADLAETVKTSLIGDETQSEAQVNKFAEKYASLGGKQAGFNKWMIGLYKQANVPQAQQLEMSLKSPFAYKMQLLMGGNDE